MNESIAIDDPRCFPEAGDAPPWARELYTVAEASLGAETGQRSDALDTRLRNGLAAELCGDGARLAAILAGAPSVAVARHLWRQLDSVWRVAAQREGAGLAVSIFAIPIVVVVGVAAARGDGVLPAVLAAPDKLAAILQEHRALAGNRTFVLSDAVVAADAIDVARLPEILTWQQLPDARVPGAALPARALEPAPMAYKAGAESVHLRFLVGSAIAAPGIDLVADATVAGWGIPFADELSRQLGGGDASVLALPRAPQTLLAAVWQGRVAQREVAAQIFASNAIRKLRAAVGEPAAVISAHRAADAAHGGELRMSLSSPFEPRDAEGFRCPLYAQDRVSDLVRMLLDLLGDCRVTDVRILDGVHPDRDGATGLPLLFKPESLPGSGAVSVH